MFSFSTRPPPKKLEKSSGIQCQVTFIFMSAKSSIKIGETSHNKCSDFSCLQTYTGKKNTKPLKATKTP